MIKCSKQQIDILKLFSQAKKRGYFWIPPNGDKQDYLEDEHRYIIISGPGVAKSIKSLWNKGLAIAIDKELYWSEITQDGLNFLEQNKKAL